MKICSVYDAAIEGYMPPFMTQTVGQAIRMFTDEVNREDSAMGQHPDDYTLFLVGEFDDTKGTITGQHPTALARAKEVGRSVG